MRIFIIGFAASGKTTLAGKLAGEMKLPCFDLDEYIENKEGKTVKELFGQYKEPYFRMQEWRYLRDFAGQADYILATGGGTPCFHQNMRWMNENGFTLYLKQPPSLLFERLKKGAATRPLITAENDTDLKNYIEHTLKVRAPYYEQADLAITGEKLPDVKEIAEMISSAHL